MLKYFVLFGNLLSLIAFVYPVFIMLQFFYRVFKHKAKVTLDFGTIILVSFLLIFSFIAMTNSVDSGSTVIITFYATVLFQRRIFAYNNELFIFSSKVCSISETKIESERVLFISRVTVTTNQITDKAKTKIIVSLTQSNHRKFKGLLD